MPVFCPQVFRLEVWDQLTPPIYPLLSLPRLCHIMANGVTVEAHARGRELLAGQVARDREGPGLLFSNNPLRRINSVPHPHKAPPLKGSTPPPNTATLRTRLPTPEPLGDILKPQHPLISSFLICSLPEFFPLTDVSKTREKSRKQSFLVYDKIGKETHEMFAFAHIPLRVRLLSVFIEQNDIWRPYKSRFFLKRRNWSLAQKCY